MKKGITIVIALFLTVVNYIAAENRVFIMDFSISAGETKDVSVLLDNETQYVAFQFDLYLPTGISLAGYEVNSERVPASTEVSMAQQEDGSYRFFAAAMAMEPIVGNNSGITILKLKASANVVTGNRLGYLRSVKLSKEDGTGQTTFEVPFTVKVLEPSIITAKSFTREYGEENPTFEYDVKGGEIEGMPEISCEATKTSPVGTYPIVLKKGTVTNYNDSYVNGTLTITKAPLIITAQSYTIKQGEALPNFEVNYSGFKNNESASVLTKKATATCAATSWSDVGTYEITVSGAKADNYDFSYVKGTLTITEADPFNLTYMVDGNVYKTYQVKYGATITPEANPTKEGYTFSGWSEIPATMPAKEVVVTGDFTINKYNLTYMVDDKTYKTIEVEYGATITAETEPTKEGYTFSGWSGIPATMPAKDVTITGSFTKGEYQLTYVVDGQAYKTIRMDYGDVITPEATPEKEGYTFSGWNEIPATMPAKDVTVTGTFVINKYTLTYIVDGETYKTYEVEFGTAITPEAEPTKEGYIFSEWSEVPATMPAKEVVVTGGFTINKYRLTYMVDDKTYKTIEVEYGASIVAESEPVKDGYTFSGWSMIPATMPSRDVMVTGSFSVNSYTLTYMVDGETYKTCEVEYGTKIVAEAEPTKEGYTFSGWSEIPATMPAKDVTVTGSFTINKYTLTYKVDGETYKSYEIEYGANITAEEEPYQKGCTFSGWSEIPATMPARDATITGSFAVNNYTLTYQVDGEIYKTYEIEYGANITAEEEPTKEGYTFSGWGEIPATMPPRDVTITGSFAVNNYTLTYQVDGKTYNSYDIEYGANITTEAEPTKEGYTFSGWSEVPATMPAHDVTITGNFTFIDAIEDITANDSEYQIFTIDGTPVETLQEGVNIIKYKNGTSKKVVVK